MKEMNGEEVPQMEGVGYRLYRLQGGVKSLLITGLGLVSIVLWSKQLRCEEFHPSFDYESINRIRKEKMQRDECGGEAG